MDAVSNALFGFTGGVGGGGGRTRGGGGGGGFAQCNLLAWLQSTKSDILLGQSHILHHCSNRKFESVTTNLVIGSNKCLGHGYPHVVN